MSDYDDKIRQLFKGGSLLVVGLVVQLWISFFGKVIIARGLSVRDFGGVALGITVASVLSTLLLLGLNEGVARQFPRYEDSADKRGVLVSAFTLVVPLGILAGGVIFLGAPILAGLFDSPDIAPVFRIFGMVIPLKIILQLVIATVQGQQRSAPKVIIQNFARPIARLSALGVVVSIGITATRVAWAYVFGWAVPVVIGIVYLYRNTNLFAMGSPQSPKRRELLRFSFPLLLTSALSIVLNDIDTALLGFFSASPEPVGIYNIAYPLATLLNTALVGFGFIFMPMISELHAEQAFDRIRRMYSVISKWIFIVTFPVFLVLAFFPTRTISLTFGAKYASGNTALTVLAVGFFINAIMGLNGESLISIGATKIKFYIAAGTAVANIILNIVLIPLFGPLGAAVATSASFILRNVVTSAYLYRQTGIIPFNRALIRWALVGGSCFLLAYTVIRFVLTPTIPMIVIGYAAFLVLYGITIIRFGGVQKEEIMIVESIEERFGVDLDPGKRIVRRIM